MKNYHFFWGGPFSQWAFSRFKIGEQEYNCAEQWMMAEKARLFGDVKVLEKIMFPGHDPATQKALGKTVKNFDLALWEQNAKLIVYRGNYAKFTQNGKLMDDLKATKGQLLVEASPYDKIWGIGLGERDPARLDESTWQGTNWLGEVITKLRVDLIGS